jgi:hypothetical protein
VARIQARLRGRFIVGVHHRVDNGWLSNLQGDGRVPTLRQLLQHARRATAGHAEWAVFLATDDAAAVTPFREDFGPRLIVRDDVQRTTAGRVEVHFQHWGKVSLTDAEDVLIDTLLLARCDVLVHISSSVSTVAALLNPRLRLVRA